MCSSSLVIQMTKVMMMIHMIQEMGVEGGGDQLQIYRQHVIWLWTAVIKKLLNNISCIYHANHHYHSSHLNHKTWATHHPHFQKTCRPCNLTSIIGCCVIQAGRGVIVHMVKGAAINRRSGLVVVCCTKIGGNEQLIYTIFYNREFSGGGGGGSQKSL